MMKTIRQAIIILGILLFSHNGFSQFSVAKKFDYSLLKGKKLYLPTYKISEKFVDKLAKKGKYEEIADVEKAAEHHNTIWKEAMAQSSYDATDYAIKAYNIRKLYIENNKEAIVLRYTVSGSVRKAILISIAERKIIASAIINGLDLSTKNDLRLMINMLNQSLNFSMNLEEEGDKSVHAVWNKYKTQVVRFYEEMADKTFLIAIDGTNSPKNNLQLTAALNSWKLSKYKLTTQEDIDKKRLEGTEECF